jgi:hypothetical protein
VSGADAGRDRQRQAGEEAIAEGEAEIAEHGKFPQPAVDRDVVRKRCEQTDDANPEERSHARPAGSRQQQRQHRQHE